MTAASVLESILPWWMLLVSGGALFGAFLGFMQPHYVQTKQFVLAKNGMTHFGIVCKMTVAASGLAARLFGAWTFLACIVRFCFFLRPEDHGLFVATFGSFVLVIFFYLNEIFNERTVPIKNGIGVLSLAGTFTAAWNLYLCLIGTTAAAMAIVYCARY